MNWKNYQNEIVVVFAFLIMLSGYIYKNNTIANEATIAIDSQKSLLDMREVISLKKLWTDKKISQRVKRLQSIVAVSKVKWRNKHKKIKASYSGLSARELNSLITKILNLPVEITLLNIQNISKSYSVELRCKW